MNKVVLPIAAAWLLVAGAVGAQQHAASGAVTVTSPWARATPPGASTGAIYMTIETKAARDRLVRVESPVAGKTELHRMSMEGDVMRMAPVSSIEVNPGKPVELKPGGLHVMLSGIKSRLEEGTTVPLTLTFEKAGTLELKVPVRPMGAAGPGGGHHHHKH